jgi:hypothetical protein
MTIVDWGGVYVGWDEVSVPLSICTVRGSVTLSYGRMVVSCDWFHQQRDSNHEHGTRLAEADGPVDGPSAEGGTVVSIGR